MYLYRIEMQIIEFQNRLSEYPVFSLQDVRKVIPDFSRIQIDRWHKKGYLRKIRQGFYSLTSRQLSEQFLLYAANTIYSPSYVSLERAFRFYELIPEEIFQITSVSTKKSTGFLTSIGNFKYRHLKSSLFWGYRLLDYGKHKILMAEPEKAILDYLYLNSHLKTTNDFAEMRIDTDSFHKQINLSRFHDYLDAFESIALRKRANTFLSIMKND